MLIFDTTYCKSAAIARQAVAAYDFLSTNRNSVVLQGDDLQLVADMKRFSKSPIVDMVKGIVDSGSLNQFAIMDVSRGIGNVPNILTLDDITVDGRYLPQTTPAGFDKPWINMATLLTKRRSPSDNIRITDIPKGCAQLVKANLSATYHDAMTNNSMWLPDAMVLFAVESYSMTVMMLLQRIYNLDVINANKIRGVFAVHFARLFPNVNRKSVYPGILNRSRFFNAGDMALIMEELTDRLGGQHWMDASIHDYCKAASEMGPARMAGFNVVVFFRLFSAFILDTIVMNIAADYPPYWIYQLMRVASGWKNTVISQYARSSSNQKAMKDFIAKMGQQELILRSK